MSPLAQRQAQLMDWINHSTPFLCQQLHMVYGDASFRRYFRFTFDERTIIAVDAPPTFEDSEEWRNISFFASLLVNLRETLKIGA